VERNSGAWLLIIYLFLSIYLLPMFPHGGSPNELSHWATAASLVEKGSFDISWIEPLIGPDVDAVKVGDKTYSSKAPGTAILAAPIYEFTRLFIGPPDAANIRVSWFAMRIVLSSLPLLLLGIWLYARDTDELSLAVLLFASPLFVYSVLFFSHVFVAVVLYMAFRFVYDQRYMLPWHCLFAGAFCGLAFIAEFSAIIPAVAFGVGLFYADKREKLVRPVFFVIGLLPFVALFGFYNYALFGSPLAPSSFGSAGFGIPSPYNFYLLLFSPSRGLLFFAPVFLFSIFAFLGSREVRTLRHQVKVAAIFLTIVVMCCHNAADGGWSFGPRYLILIMPLLLDSFFDGEVYEMSNLWQGILFGISLIFCVIPMLTFPFSPPEFGHPLRDFWTKFLINENWFVPNFANVLSGSSSIWGTLPILIAVIFIPIVVLRGMRRRMRFFVGLVIAVVVAGVYILLPTNATNSENEFRRATIAESFFRPADRLEPFKSQAEAARDAAALEQIQRAESTIADTRGYAPDDFPYLHPEPLTPGPTQLPQK
jgi:hypothetical protein